MMTETKQNILYPALTPYIYQKRFDWFNRYLLSNSDYLIKVLDLTLLEELQQRQ